MDADVQWREVAKAVLRLACQPGGLVLPAEEVNRWLDALAGEVKLASVRELAGGSTSAPTEYGSPNGCHHVTCAARDRDQQTADEYRAPHDHPGG